MVISRPLVGLALALTLGFTLSGCQALNGLLGVTEEPAAVVEQTGEGTTESTEAPAEDTTTPVAEQSPVPACDALYSEEQRTNFTEEGRELEGDISGSGYNYGTVDQDLIGLLEEVRDDLRVSCTWYLPASESASTTSVAIVASSLEPDITAALTAAGATSETLGEGTLWKIDQTSSNISEEFVANETHWVAPTTCPTSLAEPSCTLWIASNFSFGSSEALTRDVAEVLGALN